MAEVLITLTIIGVIAAITIPNLMQSWRKHQVESGLKQGYAILSNAIQMAENEYGINIVDKEYQREGNFIDHSNGDLAKRIAKYLKYNKMCMSPFRQDSAYADCPKMPSSYPLNLNYVDKILLANGMLVYIGSPSSITGIYIDVNGNKGPNKNAHDLFLFSLINTGWDRYNSRGRLVPGHGDHYNWPYYGNNIPCSAESSSYFGCSSVIMKNGWKIPDDYPIKKW